MNNKEYEQKRRECLDEFCKRYRIEEPSEQNIESFDWIWNRAYALGKQTEIISREEIEKAAWDYAKDAYYPAPDYGWYESDDEQMKEVLENTFKAGANFALGKQEKDADAVISGWVARCEEGYIDLFQGRPSRSAYYKYGRRYGCWTDDYDHHIELPREMFPDLTWESEPQEVELIIKRKKK